MLKRVFLIFLFLLVIGAAAVGWMLSSSWAAGHLLKYLLQKNLHSAKINELTIRDHRYTYPGFLSISDFHLIVTSAGQRFDVNVGKLDLDHLDRAAFKQGELIIQAQRLSLKAPSVDMPSADIKAAVLIRPKQSTIAEGTFSVPMIDAYRYTFQNVVSNFTGTSSGVLFKNFRTEFYHGQAIGKIEVNWAHDLHYRANFQFEGIDLSALKDVNHSLYEQIEGVVRGSVVIGGSVDDFDTLRLKAQVTKNGRIKAALLKDLIPQIGLLANSAEFSTALKEGQKIPVEVVTVDLKNDGKRKISGPVHLGIRKFNLDLNTSVDVLYDGSLLSLIGLDK